MSKRWVNNFLAVCVVILFLAILLVSAGCASTKLTYNPEGTTTWESWTFLKNVKDADVQWGSMHARLGSSLGDHKTVNTIFDTFDQAYWAGVVEGRRVQTEAFNREDRN